MTAIAHHASRLFVHLGPRSRHRAADGPIDRSQPHGF